MVVTEGALARKAAAKWYVALYAGLVTFFLFFLVLFPLFYDAAAHTPAVDVLRAAVIGPAMIPAGLAPSGTLAGKDYFLTAWDLDNRTPRFFTKASARDWTNQTFSNDLDVGEMVLASMSAIEYFEPASIKSISGGKNNTYISGDNVAKSPALFSYLDHKRQLDTLGGYGDIANKTYTVVSIGSVRNAPRFGLLSQYSVSDWFHSLLKHNHDHVENTMDYMLRTLLDHNDNSYYKFEARMSEEWLNTISLSSNKTAQAEQIAETIIQENKISLDQALNKLIKSKIGPHHSCFTDRCGHIFTSESNDDIYNPLDCNNAN